MKAIYFLPFLVLACSATLGDITGNCGGWTDSQQIFFDLTPIKGIYSYNNSQGQFVNFSICNPSIQVGDKNFFAASLIGPGPLLPIADDKVQDINLINENDQSGGINIIYEKFNNLQFTIMLGCVAGQKELIINSYETNSDFTQYTLKGTAGAGCVSKQVSSLWIFLSNNRKWLGITFLIIGLPLAFVGYKFLGMTIFLGAFLIVSTIIMVFFSLITTKVGNPSWLNWVALVVSALAGLIAGWFLRTCEKVGVGVLGLCGGWYLGLLLYTSWLHIYSDSELMLYLPCICLALIGAMLACVIRTYVAMVVTSFIGSYLIVRFISLYAGNFPNEMIIVQQLQSHLFNMSNDFYYYLGAILGLWIITFFFQLHMKRKSGNDEKKKEDYEALSD